MGTFNYTCSMIFPEVGTARECYYMYMFKPFETFFTHCSELFRIEEQAFKKY
jgi:hypothetical protein